LVKTRKVRTTGKSRDEPALHTNHSATRSAGRTPYTFPLGKYKGQPINLIPTHYLRWVCSQEWPQPHLRYECLDELGRRGEGFAKLVEENQTLRAELHLLRTRVAELEERFDVSKTRWTPSPEVDRQLDEVFS
jgi:uncharacterized protein (DUF3820 family)